MATVIDDETPLTRVRKLEYAAQQAAERRIHHAHDTLDMDFDDDDAPAVELAGAYCGCLTCDVREVLDAAWPFLYQAAHVPGVEPPELPGT